MTVNWLTKVNVGGTTHAPVSCNNPRARGWLLAEPAPFVNMAEKPEGQLG